MINLYAIPAALALSIKLMLLLIAYQSFLTKSRLLGVTLISLGITNAIELAGFAFAHSNENGTAMLGLQLWQLFWVLSGVLFGRMSIGMLWPGTHPRFDSTLFIATGAFIVPIFTGHYTAGYTSIGYAITRVPGEFYWVLQTVTVVAYLFPSLVLSYGWYRGDERCKSLLNFSLPMVLVVCGSVVLMNLGYAINASVFFSSATTIFALSIFYTESHSTRTKLRLFLPGSFEQRTAIQLIRDMLVFPLPLREAKQLAKDTVIHVRMVEQDGNKSAAAKALGVDPKTIPHKKDFYVPGKKT